jgi:hypothetical protein
VPPYTYTWSCDYGASIFLNDTTVSNPYLISSFYGYADTVTFYLTVVDSTGYICTDSVRVSVCEYVFISQVPAYINQGDSVLIYSSTSGGCPPFTFQWTPVYNISDPFVPNPIVWPDTTTTYYLIITDAAGCEVFDYCQVIVSSLDVIDINKANFEIILLPNPVSEYLYIETQLHELPTHITMTDITGRLVYQSTFSNMIDVSQLPKGIYFLQIHSKQGMIYSGKMVKQ